MSSSVLAQEKHGVDGTVGAGAAAVVGRTPWQLFWLRFRRDRVALAALGFTLATVLRESRVLLVHEPLAKPSSRSSHCRPAV